MNWKDDCSWWGEGYLLFGLQDGHGGPTDREQEVQAAAALAAKIKAHHVGSPKTRSNI